MEKIPSEIFIKNRYKLIDLLLPSSVLILAANRSMPKSGDQNYPFRQSSDFYYLTGIAQEDCTLVIFSGGSSSKSEEILFIPEGNKRSVIWDGPKISSGDAEKNSGIRDVRNNASLEIFLEEAFQKAKQVYFGTKEDVFNGRVASNESEIRTRFSSYLRQIEECDLEPLMKSLRIVKEEAEVAMIQQAIDITGDAYREILELVEPGMFEYEIAAFMSYAFLKNGSAGHAFDPIVASGKNALILHYILNRGKCDEGELLLMDFGADWQYYAADISRTIPVSGRFTKRQKQLYSANLRLMNAAIDLMTPGKLLAEFNKEVAALWEEEHVKLGLYSLEDIKKQDIKKPLWSKYYWHGTSHSIGIDVHDPFIHSEPLRPGMVMSCEPGIYIPNEGIGIRLENDVLITEAKAINLSENIPIEPDEIEDLMNS